MAWFGWHSFFDTARYHGSGGGGKKGLGDLLPAVLPYILKEQGTSAQKVDPATLMAASAVITAIGGLFKGR